MLLSVHVERAFQQYLQGLAMSNIDAYNEIVMLSGNICKYLRRLAMSNIDVTNEMMLLSGGIRWLAAIAAMNMRKSNLNVKNVTIDHPHVPAASMRFHSDTQHMLYARDLIMCARSMVLGPIRASQHANAGESVCKLGDSVCQKAHSDCKW